jgi:hypothetical protein
MKLSTPLFNAVLEQVQKDGPDSDCQIEEGAPPVDSNNQVFVKFIRMAQALIALDAKAAVATAFHIGFESGLQYAKVSREVRELNKSL